MALLSLISYYSKLHSGVGTILCPLVLYDILSASDMLAPRCPQATISQFRDIKHVLALYDAHRRWWIPLVHHLRIFARMGDTRRHFFCYNAKNSTRVFFLFLYFKTQSYIDSPSTSYTYTSLDTYEYSCEDEW